jgi:hypothetical protein
MESLVPETTAHLMVSVFFYSLISVYLSSGSAQPMK